MPKLPHIQFGEVKTILREALSPRTREITGLEYIFNIMDDHMDMPESVEWLRLALALRDVYNSKWWRAVGLAGMAILLCVSIEKLLYGVIRRQELATRREIRAEERALRFKELQKRLNELQLSENNNTAITSLKLESLLEKLKSGQLKPLQVLHAYQAKALAAHNKTNCLIEPIIEAEQWAEQLEGVAKEARGPLFGVPISLKENFPLAGYDTTEGCAHLIGHYYKSHCVLVKALRSLGAVPFVRTNMPQLGASHESSNPIYGRTLHPLNPSLSPGGSSSGEAALLALDGSPLGFGSDTGGSIRVPAAFCGLCAIKPTKGRISAKGRPDFNGQTIVESISCPIAQDVDSLVTAMSTLCNSTSLMHSLDPYCPLMPFNNKVYTSKAPMRIGVFTYDGICQAVPAVERVVLEAKAVLKAHGHEVVDWEPPSPEKGFMYNVSAQTGDGGARFLQNIKYDSVDPSVKDQAICYIIPRTLRRAAAGILWFLFPIYARLIRATCGVRSVSAWWDTTTEVQNYRDEFISSWNASKLDAVICPAFATPALPHYSGYSLYASNYAMLFNVLDFPAGVVPFGKYTTEDDEHLRQYFPEKTWLQRGIKKCVQDQSVGLPLSIQCVSLPWEEEVCLRVMSQLEGTNKTLPAINGKL